MSAGSLALNAGGNLVLNTAANTVNQVSATGATRTTTTLGPVANLNVAGNAVIVTGGNFEQDAGNLSVGGNLGMAVGGNYDLGTVQTGEQKVVARANGISDTNINHATGSTVNVGGVSQIGVGGNLTATGANINLGWRRRGRGKWRRDASDGEDHFDHRQQQFRQRQSRQLFGIAAQVR